MGHKSVIEMSLNGVFMSCDSSQLFHLVIQGNCMGYLKYSFIII